MKRVLAAALFGVGVIIAASYGWAVYVSLTLNSFLRWPDGGWPQALSLGGPFLIGLILAASGISMLARTRSKKQ